MEEELRPAVYELLFRPAVYELLQDLPATFWDSFPPWSHFYTSNLTWYWRASYQFDEAELSRRTEQYKSLFLQGSTSIMRFQEK